MGVLLYGANGFTGRLIAQEAAQIGLHPMLAGRSTAKVAAVAAPFSFSYRIFPLDDRTALRAGLEGVQVVLLCAGPFVDTAPLMVSACLEMGIHYLDITGEIPVFQMAAALDARARRAGVMLLPGAGFDVVPSDSLAAHLKRRLPSATHLRLAFKTSGGVSRGTALTAIGQGHRGGRVRRSGTLEEEPLGARVIRVDFGSGLEAAASIPWGDLETASHTTGIPNIETYAAFGRETDFAVRAARGLAPFLRIPAVRGALRAAAGRISGPDAAARASGYGSLWGEAWDEYGRRAAARMLTPEPYRFTSQSALYLANRALAADAPPGYQTPAGAYGPDAVLEIPGVSREDV